MSDDVLDLSGQNLWSKMLKSKLEELLNPGIRRLNLSSCHIDAECCEILCNFIQDPSTRLLSLDISGTRVTVAEATKIFESIKNSSILEFFADNLTLKEESIRKLAESLSENSNIKLLSICGSDMNHQCIELIANILPKAENLQYLRLESNSMYNTGCIALASNLINSNLISLEIGDNMIWEDAMKVLIDAVADEKSKIEFLDISYNCVNLSYLAQNLRKMPHLKGLALSGCKVNEKYILEFFNVLHETNIETLILDGLNFDPIPVSWPKVQDTVLSNSDNFEVFLLALKKSKTLADVRLGFIDFEQIMRLYHHLSGLLTEQNRELTITVHDFMKSNDFVLIHYPSFEIECPEKDIIIKSDISNIETDAFGLVISKMISHDGPINNLEISLENTIDNQGIENALASLAKTQVEILTITFQSYSQFTLNGIQKAISGGAPIRELVLNDSKFTEFQFGSFFTFLSNTPNTVKNITIGFTSPRALDTDFHECMNPAKEFFLKPDMEEIYLQGTISGADALLVVQTLKENQNITVLDIETALEDHYKSPDPPMSQESIEIYRNVALALVDALSAGSKLSTFSYPMLTELFLDDTETLNAWKKARDKIAANSKK